MPSVEQCEREAREAAKQYDDVNFVCRYPFDSPQGSAYRRAFLQALADAAFTPETTE